MASVYVAGRVSEAPRVQQVQRMVEQHGHVITFDWTRAKMPALFRGWHHNPGFAQQLAREMLAAASRCQICILVDPRTSGHPIAGRAARGGLGCYVEAGAALASGADLWILEPQRDSIFWYLEEATKMPGVFELNTALEGW